MDAVKTHWLEIIAGNCGKRLVRSAFSIAICKAFPLFMAGMISFDAYGQVTAGSLLYWDANNPALYNNGMINGGSGTWTANSADSSWTSSSGNLNGPWTTNAVAIFEATPGTITVDTSAGAVNFSGAQFAANGYVITGQPLTTTTANTTVQVGDGTGAGASMTATIASVIQGSGGLTKTDLGTLVLTGNNTYSGVTTINGGTLQLGNGGSSGAIAGSIVDNGTLAFFRNDSIFMSTTISGAGNISFYGSGVSGQSSYQWNGAGDANFTGTFAIMSGARFSLTNPAPSAGVVVSSGGELWVQGNGTYTMPISLAGTGWQESPGLLGAMRLTGAPTVAGPVILTSNARITTYLTADTGVASGVIGDGGHGYSLEKTGAGTLTFSGNNTYGGGTLINGAGTLVATQGNALGTGNVTNNANLQLNFAGNSILANPLSGPGALIKTGNGLATLTASDSNEGSVAVNGGSLQFGQSGAFNVRGNYSTASGATTATTASSALIVANQFAMSGTFNDVANPIQPTITTGTTVIGAGATYNLAGYSAPVETSASTLASAVYNVIHATTSNGLSGTFANVDLGGSSSSVDFLTLTPVYTAQDFDIGLKLTWYAAHTATPQASNGVFTLSNTSNFFNLDVLLANEVANPATGWDGQTLTKNGAGTLELSKANTYAGGTLVNAGTLQAGIANAFASSADVTVASGATLDLNNFNQQANNLSGAGNVTLGSAALTVNNSIDSTFSGLISGSGSLSKTGAGTLTLRDANTYGGGTTIGAGVLDVTQASALGSGAIVNNATLQLDFSSASALANILSGSGDLLKTGGGIALLTGATPSEGNVAVNAGALQLGPAVALNVSGDYGTASGAATTMFANSTLVVGNQFAMNGTLNDVANPNQPTITASTASIGVGTTFNLAGYSVPAQTSASQLASTFYDVIHTTTPNGLNGTFTNISVGGNPSPVDFLTMTPVYTAQDFDIGLGLTWYAAHGAEPQTANGVFTLPNAGYFFNMDVVLANEVANPVTGWDGQTLTKNGAGTLELSKVNTYAGDTLINAGTLQAGITNAFADSANVMVASGATLDLNNFDQQTNNLSGAGNVTLGSAILTANSTVDTTFAGVISGSGSLNKTGGNTLLLTTVNTYTGTTAVDAGALVLANNAALISAQPVNVASGAIFGGYGSVGGDVINDGLLAVADAAPGFTNGPAGQFSIGGQLINNGEIRMSSATPASILLVGGNYIGNNGLLTLSTTLGEDNSATDKLVVLGSTAGATRVAINNAGGMGAQTTNGIEIVQVGGASDGSFALQGRVVAGAYEYQLVQGTPNGNDGDWYLSSVANLGPTPPAPPTPPTPPTPPPPPPPIPLLRPEAGTYLSNQVAANALFIHTLDDRLGGPPFADAAVQGGSGWARVSGASSNSDAAHGLIGQQAQSSLVQFGADLLDSTMADSRLLMGAMGGAGQITDQAVARDNPARSHGRVDGYSVGAYATWFINQGVNGSGFYLDGWAQYGEYNNKTIGDLLPTQQYDSHNWVGSLEAGYAFALLQQKGNPWYIEPEAQLFYSDYRQAALTEVNGTQIRSDGVGGWISRLGVRFYGRNPRNNGDIVQPFVELNWWHSQNQAAVMMNDTRVDDDMPRNRYELKVGLLAQLGKRWSLWADLGVQAGGDNYSGVQGQLGAKFSW